MKIEFRDTSNLWPKDCQVDEGLWTVVPGADVMVRVQQGAAGIARRVGSPATIESEVPVTIFHVRHRQTITIQI